MPSYKFIVLLPGILSAQICVWAGMSVSAAQHLGFDHASTNQKVVALTFDADMTPSMLNRLKTGKIASWYNSAVIDRLRELQVPATLFLTGLWMEAYPVITRDLSNDPLFELGNHSYSHGAFRTPCYGLAHTPQPNQTAEVRQTDELLKKYAVSYKKYFRFPGLCFDMEVARSVEAEGYIVVGGDVYSGDGFETKPAKIVYNVMAHVHPGSIIIFHLQGGRNAPETANALVAIVQKLRSQGYAFVKVSELLKLRGSG